MGNDCFNSCVEACVPFVGIPELYVVCVLACVATCTSMDP